MKDPSLKNFLESRVKEMISEAIVHELKVVTCERGKATYPTRTSSMTIGLYSTLERAQAEMGKSIITDTGPLDEKDSGNGESIHHFIIQAKNNDAAQLFSDDCERRVYDSQGILYGICKSANEPFSGKKPEECKYREGELVEVDDHGLLRPGIISMLPITPEIVRKLPAGCADQTDNVYCVEFSYMDRTHDHLPECDLFRPRFPMNNSTKTRLMWEYKYLRLPHESYGTNSSGKLMEYEEYRQDTGLKYPLRISDCMSAAFRKPYVIIHDSTHEIRVYVSLETFRLTFRNLIRIRTRSYSTAPKGRKSAWDAVQKEDPPV